MQYSKATVARKTKITVINSNIFITSFGIRKNKIERIGQDYEQYKKDGMILLSLIVCTSECLYQQDGYCSLERAVSGGAPSKENPCVNFVPRRSSLQNSGQGFPDISDPDQL